jgi:hypothetical protein
MTLRKIFPDLPRVDGAILLTQEPSKVKRLAGREVRGVRFSTLNDWKGALGVGSPPLLSRQQVPNLGRVLEPKTAVALDGSLRCVGQVCLEVDRGGHARFAGPAKQSTD